jgi:hypothetical protein
MWGRGGVEAGLKVSCCVARREHVHVGATCVRKAARSRARPARRPLVSPPTSTSCIAASSRRWFSFSVSPVTSAPVLLAVCRAVKLRLGLPAVEGEGKRGAFEGRGAVRPVPVLLAVCRAVKLRLGFPPQGSRNHLHLASASRHAAARPTPCRLRGRGPGPDSEIQRITWTQTHLQTCCRPRRTLRCRAQRRLASPPRCAAPPSARSRSAWPRRCRCRRRLRGVRGRGGGGGGGGWPRRPCRHSCARGWGRGAAAAVSSGGC